MWHTTKRDSTGYCSSTIYCLAPASMGYCSSTVDSLQTPRATVHPPLTSSSLHLLLFIQPSMGSCSSSLHRLLFNQPSTGSCSTSPPRAPSIGYYSSTPTSLIGVLFIQRQQPLLPRDHVHPTPTQTVHPTPTKDCSTRGSFDRLQLAAVAKGSLVFS